MAEVVYLKTGERPSTDMDWVLLTKAPSGKYEVSAGVGYARSASFGFAVMDTLRLALVDAQKRAERFNVKTIYVRGVTEAERP